MRPDVICLMGPTASGKTPLAIHLKQQFPCDIISVDSAMIYKGMDIGTAKPSTDILQIAPHRLIDHIDPRNAYSAGQFYREAMDEIRDIQSANKIPLLVGGTMLYFRVLYQGIAQLPPANRTIRQQLNERIKTEGLSVLHAELMKVDPQAAAKINAGDSQRIQRALEVYLITGKPISFWQRTSNASGAPFQMINIALAPSHRQVLHERILKRFQRMLELGLIDEVERLYHRGDLTSDLPSIRSVGYRQVWAYLEGKMEYDSMREKAVIATRQLAKRQLTWLRTWPEVQWFDSEAPRLTEEVSNYLAKRTRL